MIINGREIDGNILSNLHHRPPRVEAGLEFLYEIYEREYVDQIAYHNPIKYFGL